MLIQNKKTLSFPNQTYSNSSIQFLQVFEECSKFPPDEHFQFQVNISTKGRKNWREGEWWSSFGRSPTTKKEASGIARLEGGGGGLLVFIVTTAEALDYIILASTRDQLWESLFIRFQLLIRIARSSFLPEPWSAVVQNCSLVRIKRG